MRLLPLRSLPGNGQFSEVTSKTRGHIANLLSVDDIHDDASFEHLRKPNLDGEIHRSQCALVVFVSHVGLLVYFVILVYVERSKATEKAFQIPKSIPHNTTPINADSLRKWQI